MNSKNFIFALLVFLLVGCKKEKENSSIVTVDPYDIVLSYSMGEVVTFKIKASSPTEIQKLTISTKETSAFTEIILDSTLNKLKSFSWNYEYKIPAKTNAYQLDIYFTFTDINGNEFSAARKINVAIGNGIVSEFTGNVFYSFDSGKENSFDLNSMVALFSNSSPTTSLDLKNDATYDGTDSLARSWVSPAGSSFVRFNGFDYENATLSTIVNSYESGLKNDTISNLQAGDFIFTKINRNGTETYIAIKLTSIFDLPGTTNDTYIFSMKK